MNEQEYIQSRGFKNVSRNGQVTGFQVRYRTPYYRGVACSLIEGAEITVDGEKFGREQITWTISGRTFTHAELAKASDVHWQFLEPAILTVNKPGGLKPGFHDVEISYSYRASYMAATNNWVIGPTVSQRKMVLVG